MELQRENHELKRREDGNLFTASDTADSIVAVLLAMLTPNKAETVARGIVKKLKDRKSAAA